MTNSRAREGNRQGSQAERINRRRKLKKEQEKKEVDSKAQSQLHSQPQSKKLKKVYRIEKDKTPEAKGRWDNVKLRKVG